MQPNRRGPVTRHLRFVDVDADHLSGRRHAPVQVLLLHAAADADHQIGAAPEFVASGQNLRERAAIRYHAPPVAETCYGCLQPFRQLVNFRRRRNRATARYDERRFRPRHQPGGSGRIILIHRQPMVDWRGRQCLHTATTPHDVHRHLQGHWPGPPSQHVPKRLIHHARCGFRRHDPTRPAGQRLERRQLIRQFVQITNAAPEAFTRNLSGQAQHRRIGCVGGTQCGGCVQHPRAGNHAVHARPAGGARVTERHVRRPLLVPAADVANAVAGALHRIEEVIELPAGQTVDGIDPIGQKLGQQGVRTGHLIHGRSFGIRHSGLPVR